MCINFIGSGKIVEITSVQGCDSMCKKNMEMGMSEGAIIKIIKNDSGPLIVNNGEVIVDPSIKKGELN